MYTFFFLWLILFYPFCDLAMNFNWNGIFFIPLSVLYTISSYRYGDKLNDDCCEQGRKRLIKSIKRSINFNLYTKRERERGGGEKQGEQNLKLFAVKIWKRPEN